jgi:tetrahydromethanopterin S-methyltransferase subunit F
MQQHRGIPLWKLAEENNKKAPPQMKHDYNDTLHDLEDEDLIQGGQGRESGDLYDSLISTAIAFGAIIGVVLALALVKALGGHPWAK